LFSPLAVFGGKNSNEKVGSPLVAMMSSTRTRAERYNLDKLVARLANGDLRRGLV
jgi:hypothetical protein